MKSASQRKEAEPATAGALFRCDSHAERGGCVAATVEHLALELRMQNIPHEIVTVDDRSTDTDVAVLAGPDGT